MPKQHIPHLEPTKECTKCKQRLPHSSFSSRGSNQKHVLKSHCKPCAARISKLWAARNRKRYLQYQRDYQARLRSIARLKSDTV